MVFNFADVYIFWLYAAFWNDICRCLSSSLSMF